MNIEITEETNIRLRQLIDGKEYVTYNDAIQRLLDFWDNPPWNPQYE